MSKCLISVKCLSASCKRTFGSPGIFKEAQNQTFTTTTKKTKIRWSSGQSTTGLHQSAEQGWAGNTKLFWFVLCILQKILLFFVLEIVLIVFLPCIWYRTVMQTQHCVILCCFHQLLFPQVKMEPCIARSPHLRRMLIVLFIRNPFGFSVFPNTNFTSVHYYWAYFCTCVPQIWERSDISWQKTGLDSVRKWQIIFQICSYKLQHWDVQSY